jgi:hypothetical protein
MLASNKIIPKDPTKAGGFELQKARRQLRPSTSAVAKSLTFHLYFSLTPSPCEAAFVVKFLYASSI